MKLYTKSGDDGTTGLFGGGRVPKDHPRIEAYGTVDELNASVGLAAAACSHEREYERRLLGIFAPIQSRLFDIGADLATPEGSKQEAKIVRIDDALVKEIESWIDEIDGKNAPIRAFVMPGGSELAARLHVARTVCRRAERCMIALARSEPVSPGAIIWINRLSDLFFAMARHANQAAGIADVEWKPRRS
jgi:cob(I)alamin adenosyltransferase